MVDMNNVTLWAARFHSMHEAMMEHVEEIEQDDPDRADDYRANAEEWKSWELWLLQYAVDLPPLPRIRVTETLGR